MKFFSVKDAIKAVKKYEKTGLNFQRERVLDSIQRKSKRGQTYLVLEDPTIRLDGADYKFFEDLGYLVKPHVMLANEYRFGVISWGDTW